MPSPNQTMIYKKSDVDIYDISKIIVKDYIPTNIKAEILDTFFKDLIPQDALIYITDILRSELSTVASYDNGIFEEDKCPVNRGYRFLEELDWILLERAKIKRLPFVPGIENKLLKSKRYKEYLFLNYQLIAYSFKNIEYDWPPMKNPDTYFEFLENYINNSSKANHTLEAKRIHLKLDEFETIYKLKLVNLYRAQVDPIKPFTSNLRLTELTKLFYRMYELGYFDIPGDLPDKKSQTKFAESLLKTFVIKTNDIELDKKEPILDAIKDKKSNINMDYKIMLNQLKPIDKIVSYRQKGRLHNKVKGNTQ